MRIILSTIERTVADKPVRVARAIEPAGKLAGLPPSAYVRWEGDGIILTCTLAHRTLAEGLYQNITIQ